MEFSLRKASNTSYIPDDFTVPGKVKAGPKGSVLGGKMSIDRIISVRFPCALKLFKGPTEWHFG